MLKFDEVRRGYDKMQVEEYVRMLKGEYVKLQDELETVSLDNINSIKITEEITSLKEDMKALEEEKIRLEQENKDLREQSENFPPVQESAYSEAIASAIVSAEISAKQIITKAQKEAEGINDAAIKELADIIAAKQQVFEEIKQVSKKLLRIIRDDKEIRDAGIHVPALPEKPKQKEETQWNKE